MMGFQTGHELNQFSRILVSAIGYGYTGANRRRSAARGADFRGAAARRTHPGPSLGSGPLAEKRAMAATGRPRRIRRRPMGETGGAPGVHIVAASFSARRHSLRAKPATTKVAILCQISLLVTCFPTGY